MQIESREIWTHEIFDDPLVDNDRESDAEDSDESEVATGPAEIVLEVLPSGSPILDELVLVRFHTSTHLCFLDDLTFFSLSLLRVVFFFFFKWF